MYPGIHAKERPDTAAIVMMGTGATRTYAELDERSNQLAHLLRDHGVEQGDTVALVLDNRLEVGEAMWAGMRSGLFVSPLNFHLTANELSPIIEAAEAKVVLTVDAFAAVVRDAVRPLTDDVLIVVLDGGDKDEGMIGFDGMRTQLPATPIDDEAVGARFLFSSGTTGRPKGFRRPLPGRHPAEGPITLGALGERLGIHDPDIIYLSTAPIYHSAPFTFVLTITSHGGTVVMAERFDAADCLAAIDRYSVTHSQWVPTMFVRLLRLPHEKRDAHDMSTHRVAVHAGAPCPVTVKDEMMAWWGPILHEYYGASEGYGQTYIGPEEWLTHPGSVGQPLKGSIEIRDDSGRVLRPNELGHVFFVAPGASTGRSVGDLGYLDPDGFLYLHGRDGHTIITGGVNVYPREVEDALLADDRVLDAVVVGLPDVEFGQRVGAVLELTADANRDDTATIIESLRDRIAGFKLPRLVHVADRLPRMPTGKADLRTIHELLDKAETHEH